MHKRNVINQCNLPKEIKFCANIESNILACYDYDGLQVCAAIQHENITGLQFHPEKSSLVGLDILKSFLST